jgi:hypothetical protein
MCFGAAAGEAERATARDVVESGGGRTMRKLALARPPQCSPN